MSLISLKNDQLAVTISTRGAEMQNIQDAQGHEYLWQRDPAYWTGCAPIMFPVCGGFKNDCYTLDGVTYTMPKHGFVRQLEWTLKESNAVSASFEMTQKHPGFPFDYEFVAGYGLEGNKIVITNTVSNKGDKPFVYGIGSHEAYALDGALENYSILFDEKETLANYELEGNLLKTEPVIMGENTDRLDLKTEFFAVDALVFPKLKSRGVTLVNRLNDRRVRVDFQDLDVLMFWQKPGAGYICIEPWSNAPDYVDADGDIRHKKGMIALNPGESDTRRHIITLL